MKSKEFEKIIDSSYNKEMQAIYDNLKQRLNIPDDAVSAPAQSQNAAAQKPKNKRRTSFKNFFKQPVRLAACVSAAVAVACLAIILPFTLNRDGGLQATTPPTSDNPSTANDRFCVAAACKEIELKYSLKEYSARNNLSLLYIDWNDKADIKTSLHINNEEQTDIVYYEEILKHKGTGSIAELYITDLHTKVDRVEEYKKVCENSYIIERPVVNSSILKYPVAKVFWGCDMLENGEPYTYQAYFTFVKYEYTLVLRYPMSENSIFELIDSMLPAFKR